MSVSPGSQSVQGGPVTNTVSAHDAEGDYYSPDQPILQKRKGGRKPIYATSEERKQRNRQAQAAFRERRTEYIKQLEENLKHNDNAMEQLHENERRAIEECNHLRFKNSLLERIIAEKGFDVQAELHARSGPSISRPQHAAPASPGAPIVQQAIMNRHQQAMRHPSSASAVGKHDTTFNTPLQSLHISHPSTPLSSRYSSPAASYLNSPGMDGHPRTHAPQHQPLQHTQQTMPPRHDNYLSFPAHPPLSQHVPRSDQHVPQNDMQFGQGGFAGYHTPTSIDDHSSRHSSMTQANMTSLGKLSPSLWEPLI